MRYDAILLDADDTVFDFAAAEREAIHQVLENLHITDENAPAAYSRINAACWADFEKGLISQDELRVRRFRELLLAYGIADDPHEAADAFVNALSLQAPLLPGAEEAVARMSERVPVAIVTNGISAVQHSRFERSSIRHYISALCVSGDVGFAKPDPRMFDAALQMLTVDRSRALMVGDSLASDILGAQNAGIAACWYNPKDKPCTLPREPEYRIRSLFEISDYIL